jgi:hypothetical protein
MQLLLRRQIKAQSQENAWGHWYRLGYGSIFQGNPDDVRRSYSKDQSSKVAK